MATVELEDPLGHVVEEVAVVGHRDHGAGVFLEVTLQPRTDSASRWLVGSSSSSMSGADSSSWHSATRRFSPPESFADQRVPFGQAQGVRGDVELALQFPGARRVDGILQLRLLFEQRVHLLVRHGFGELLADFV